MYTVYVLRNNLTGRHYIGSTNNFERRISEHRRGHTKSTKQKGDWELVYKEKIETSAQAKQRERQIKSYKGGNAFKKLLRAQFRSRTSRCQREGRGCESHRPLKLSGRTPRHGGEVAGSIPVSRSLNLLGLSFDFTQDKSGLRPKTVDFLQRRAGGPIYRKKRKNFFKFKFNISVPGRISTEYFYINRGLERNVIDNFLFWFKRFSIDT